MKGRTRIGRKRMNALLKKTAEQWMPEGEYKRSGARLAQGGWPELGVRTRAAGKIQPKFPQQKPARVQRRI